jgi:hypothetical protein
MSKKFKILVKRSREARSKKKQSAPYILALNTGSKSSSSSQHDGARPGTAREQCSFHQHVECAGHHRGHEKIGIVCTAAITSRLSDVLWQPGKQ